MQFEFNNKFLQARLFLDGFDNYFRIKGNTEFSYWCFLLPDLIYNKSRLTN